VSRSVGFPNEAGAKGLLLRGAPWTCVLREPGLSMPALMEYPCADTGEDNWPREILTSPQPPRQRPDPSYLL